jgi:Rieske 2Fe-2S family protein
LLSTSASIPTPISTSSNIARNWFLAGHVSELAEPGDFKVLKVARESVIIVRGSDGVIKAFANVCRHRGSLVCLERRGNSRKFACPYHGWTYDMDGKLIAARSMPDDFDKSEYSLRPVSYGEIHGLMFICFCDDPPTLEGAIRDLAEPMALFDFPKLKVAANQTYDIPANWKICIENYQECYHCATAHPEYARMHTLMLEPGKREHLYRFSGHQGAPGRDRLRLQPQSVVRWLPDRQPGWRSGGTPARQADGL